MSVKEFSPVLQNLIINRLRRRLGKTDLAFLKSLDTSNIRSETNAKAKGYEAVLSRGNLQSLANQFSNTADFKQNPEYSKISKIAASMEDLEQLASSASSLLSNTDLFDNFISYLKDTAEEKKYRRGLGGLEYAELNKDIKYGRESSIEKSFRDIIISRETHGSLIPLFTDFLKSSASGVSVEPRLVDFIREQLNAGHLVGVFNIRFKRLFNLRRPAAGINLDTVGDVSKTITNNVELTEFLNTANKLFIQADFISSNALENPEIFLTAEKRVYGDNPSVTVEIQLARANQEIGRKLTSISRSLEELISSIRGQEKTVRFRVDAIGAKKALQTLAKGLSELSNTVKQRAAVLKQDFPASDQSKITAELNRILTTTDTLDKMIQSRGSDSLIQSIENVIVARVLGKPVPKQQKTTVSIKDKPVKKQVLKSTSAKTFKTTNRKISNKNITVKKVVTPPVGQINLVSLLNARLHDQIQKNMGTGDRRDVLNYRTGRFATSVKVERVSESRMGMITAFYTYMKNPYATFSQGGLQQFPRTRDPKTLISKSIREIASTLVTNQLRAVNV